MDNKVIISEEKSLLVDGVDSLVSSIRETLDEGKKLVIFIGAGVSDKLVPSMDNLFRYICNSEKLNIGDEAYLKELSELARVGANRKIDNLPRSTIYSLYSTLQDESIPSNEVAWQDFGIDLLSGKVRSDAQQEEWSTDMILPHIKPTPCHDNLAHLVRTFFPNIIVISLNFDGLMAKAIRNNYESSIGTFHGLRILSSKGSVIRFFSAKQSRNSIEVPLVKLRGDIFHAICKTENCSNYDKELPIYDLDFKAVTGDTVDIVSDQLRESVVCRECSKTMRLSITFPGIRKKEQENLEILKELIVSFGHSIGCIATIGTSGRWDSSIIEFMKVLNETYGTKLYVVFKTNPPYLVEALANNCTPIQCDKDDLAEQLVESLQSQANTVKAHTTSRKCAYDGIWLKEKYREQFQLQLIGSDEEQFTLSYHGRGHDLTDDLKLLSNLSIVERLKNISQLGIKNEVLHTKSYEQLDHTRNNHCMGTSLLAQIWYDALVIKSPKSLSASIVPINRKHLLTASYLHDLGHLPFGHLTEEIMRELNWTSPSNPPTYSHEDIDFSLYKEHGQSNLQEILESENYNTLLLQRMIKGNSGTLFCDTLLNSGIDCDKIDYVFRDTELTRKKIRLDDPHSWLSEFIEFQEVTKEGLIRLNGLSALRTIELLEERLFLYKNFYLLPEVRILESVCRTVLISWLVPQMPDWLDDLLNEGTAIFNSEDTRSLKGQEAANAMIEVLSSIEVFTKNEFENTTLEVPFLRKIFEELQSGKQDLVDEKYINWINAIVHRLEKLFEELQRDKSNGDDVIGYKRKPFVSFVEDFELLGSWKVNKRKCNVIREICRELKVQYPCTVIFDIVEVPDFWSIPSSRRLDFDNSRVQCTGFLIPNEAVGKWNRKSIGKIPPSLVDFTNDFSTYAQILLIRPSHSQRGRCIWVRDLFIERCRREGIELDEKSLQPH